MQNFLKKLAVFFGVGLFPRAPGTMGSLAAVPLAMLLNWAGPFYMMGFIMILLPLSILAAQAYENSKGGHDHSEIVIDEVVGLLITMTWLPITWQSVIFGFLLFRVLDIWKPFPIGYLDKRVQGGLGVVLDDVAAGLIANVLLQIVYTKTSWLGVQIQ
ncbi:MAG: phosphatidylglycerophosphatase A [Bdellovibrio sp. CG10_big_fil_rev_8_21_14_0_10_47_8]|nr:MAG: phosphatidylglycerophosphatase A [Bdellovibrio sp. CG10_big_fil_rev_8_21_14_0_10_47_8]